MIFDYFFIRLYNYYSKSKVRESPRFYATTMFGVLININLIEVSGLLSKLDILLILLPYDNKTITYMSTPVIVIFLFLIYNKNRIEAIKIKFTKDEFKHKKKKLNIAFTLWIVLTILAIFILAWWKPGYLPSW